MFPLGSVVSGSAPSAMPGGGQPPLAFHTPPPATPQPEPRTGAAPGERHGMMRVQSPGPVETSTLTVRYMGSLSVGGPGIIPIVGFGCVKFGCENIKQGPEKWVP